MTDTTPPTISRGQTDELIPCPAGHIGTTRNNNNIYGTWWVQCCQCAWRTAGDTEAEALTAWNTRANADARLVEALDNANVSRAVMASVNLGKWLAAALDDPNVCDAMKADIREWFSAGEPLSAARAALSEVPHG